MGHYEEMGHKVLMFVTDTSMYEFHFCILQQIWTPEITLVSHAFTCYHYFAECFFAYIDYNTVDTRQHILQHHFNMIPFLCLDPICGIFQCSLTTTHFWSWLFKTKWRLCVTCNIRDLNFATHQVSLCVSRQHIGSGETVALIFNLSSVRRSVVTVMLQPLYRRGKGPGTDYIGEWAGPISGLDILAKRNISWHFCRCIYVFHTLILIINSNYWPIQN
jgi:hypothetical protein